MESRFDQSGDAEFRSGENNKTNKTTAVVL